jgi:hypothetical protein
MTNANLSRDGKNLTVRLALTFHKSGHRKRVIVPNGSPSWQPAPTAPNSVLLNAVARAHRWKQMLESGQYNSLKELAKAEKINFSYVCRILRLSLLSPMIIETILDGRQEPSLELRHLLKPLPSSWKAQEAMIAEKAGRGVTANQSAFRASDRVTPPQLSVAPTGDSKNRRRLTASLTHGGAPQLREDAKSVPRSCVTS